MSSRSGCTLIGSLALWAATGGVPAQGAPRQVGQAPESLATLSLPARAAVFATRKIADETAAIALGTLGGTKFAFVCNALRRSSTTNARGHVFLNPSVQRVNLATGSVETVLRGLDGCGALVLTSWGTLVAGERGPDGGLYEVLEPAATKNVPILDRSTGRVPTRFARVVLSV